MNNVTDSMLSIFVQKFFGGGALTIDTATVDIDIDTSVDCIFSNIALISENQGVVKLNIVEIDYAIAAVGS